ncbi:type II 3-dehydroquinate dehydratase [Candidatus Marinamargulisbacteria bacterium SCGC AG-414-C22]|nr:type II 3-dehydroquinate dehydratase [Candidatus Marinamargulisbacteria bacterium SCGC AG-414-C22]
MSRKKTDHSLLILHGPNLNKLGQRDTSIYGSNTLEDINDSIQTHSSPRHIGVDILQSNHEGDIVEKIQAADSVYHGIIINPAAYTHTSLAIRDAIDSITIPVIEVHLSNIHAREEFRHKSLSAPACVGQISGFGGYGYLIAIDAMINHIKSN